MAGRSGPLPGSSGKLAVRWGEAPSPSNALTWGANVRFVLISPKDSNCKPIDMVTQLAVSLGLAAIDRGYAVSFTPMHRLAEDLRNSYEERRRERRMRGTWRPSS